VAEELGRRTRTGDDPSTPPARRAIPGTAIEAFLEDLADGYGGLWSKRFTEEPGGIARLAEEALERLEAMGLVARRPEGVIPLPALARYEAREVERPGNPDRDDRDHRDQRDEEGDGP
jgi:hypothetical protein